MKTSTYSLALLGCISMVFVGCAENPADSVAKAEVSDVTPETPETSATTSVGETITYAFTEASKIGFVGSKVTGSHKGGFEKFSGMFTVAGDQPGVGPHKIEIDMESTWSDHEKLTGHLKNADFFNVAEFPTSTFEVTAVTPADADGAYTLDGTLTLHGVTKAISFPATIKKTGDGHVTLDSEFAINRKDFGIVYTGKKDDLIRDEVVIKLAMVAAPEA